MEGTEQRSLVIPPKDILTYLEKTAKYVHMGGVEFEQRVRLERKGDTKFQFIEPDSPYYPYYQAKLAELKGTGEKLPEKVIPDAVKKLSLERQNNMQEVKALTKNAHESKVDYLNSEPKKCIYAIKPPLIPALDIDIIQVTAQFVARNGKSFLIELMQRESGNPQFDFLKPTHLYFGYFTTYVDIYTKLILPVPNDIYHLKKVAANPLAALERIRHRFVYENHHRQAKEKRDKEEDDEHQALKFLNWTSFVVVDTINFNEDTKYELPRPLDIHAFRDSEREKSANLAKLFLPVLPTPLAAGNSRKRQGDGPVIEEVGRIRDASRLISESISGMPELPVDLNETAQPLPEEEPEETPEEPREIKLE